MNRRPAVAGSFYPDDPAALAGTVDRHLAEAARRTEAQPRPKALIAPHAGYVYSGPIAATAYECLRPHAREIERVVLAGPSHRVPLRGVAVSGADAFDTPLGPVPLDEAGRRTVLALPGATMDDRPHALEHSLEVHLPFLQRVLGQFLLLPLVVGEGPPSLLADVLDAVWGGPETLLVVSTDLSHYHDDATAKRLDRATAAAIVDGRFEDIEPLDACGAAPLRGLLLAARRRGLAVELLDLRTSADTAGSADRVVGYGAFSLA